MRESGVPVTEVRYERLVTDPAAATEELARALGVPAGSDGQLRSAPPTRPRSAAGSAT